MDRYSFNPGKSIKLSDWNSRDNGGRKKGKLSTRKQRKTLNSRLETFQETLYAQGKHRILVEILESLELKFPQPQAGLDSMVIK